MPYESSSVPQCFKFADDISWRRYSFRLQQRAWTLHAGVTLTLCSMHATGVSPKIEELIVIKHRKYELVVKFMRI